ncbi:MAG: peptidoglycan-binding protein [Candidatus Eisenbacteria bacterium]|nr:peptidoglycan-binding protein [Candidatus Eisenbacteria bacterium]
MRRVVCRAVVGALLAAALLLGAGRGVAKPGDGPRAAAVARPGESATARAVIEKAQKILISAGRLRGKADGRMSPATRSAIRAYQKQHGLKGTGKLTPETLARMGLAPDTSSARPQSPQVSRRKRCNPARPVGRRRERVHSVTNPAPGREQPGGSSKC